MNTIGKILICILFGMMALACGEEKSDPTPTPAPEDKEAVQLQKLAKTWKTVSVMKDDEDVTNRFTDFTITFTKQKSYTTTPSRGNFDVAPFPASGAWDFRDDNLNLIARSDGVDMDITVTESKLALQFQISNPNGKVLGLGEYNFALVPQ